MGYEYNKGLGTHVLEVYGTTPYAQQWIAEDFDLKELPSVESITPPISYRKPYQRMVTAYRQGPITPPPPLPFRGFESFVTGGGFFIGAGLLLGYLAYRILTSSQYEQNQAISSLRPVMELWSNPDEDDYEDLSDVGACEYISVFEDEDVRWEREELGWRRRWPRPCPQTKRPYKHRYQAKTVRQ